jgi:hypothetical protein
MFSEHNTFVKSSDRVITRGADGLDNIIGASVSSLLEERGIFKAFTPAGSTDALLKTSEPFHMQTCWFFVAKNYTNQVHRKY